MNETVFKEVKFEEKNKMAVFQKIKSQNKTHTFPSFKNIIPRVLSITVPPILLFSFLHFSGINFISAGQKDIPIELKKEKEVFVSQNTNGNQSSFVIDPTDVKEQYKDLSKEDVFQMLTNKGNFETVNGSFELFTLAH